MFFKTKELEKDLELENTVIGEFNKFINSGKERLVIGLSELSKEEADFYRAQLPKGWMSFEQAEHPYYPNILLESEEKQVINQDKEYQIICFVEPKTMGIAPYDEPGVEIISRVHTNAMMPKMMPISNWNYSSLKNFFPQSKLNEFIELLNEDKDFNPSKFAKQIESAHKSYDGKTQELMEKDKLQRNEALYKLDLRNEPADEYLFREMRTGISNAGNRY